MAPATIPELTTDPLTLSFIWFEWPPAQALEKFANEEYKKERPNATIKVNTVPNANWHDAMFTQFAARKTAFDIAILDSQHIGEAVTNGNILDITDFVKTNIDVKAYNPYLLAAYGQFPQAETGQRDEDASLYGPIGLDRVLNDFPQFPGEIQLFGQELSEAIAARARSREAGRCVPRGMAAV